MKVLAGMMGAILALGHGALPHAASTPTSSLVASSGRITAAPALATKTPLSARAAKAELKTARGSMQSGRLADALARYESVLASSTPAGESRAEALYWAGLLRLSRDPALRDIDRARAYLGELKVFHAASGHQDEAAIVLALSEEIEDQGRAADMLRSELASSRSETEACRSQKGEADGRLQAALGENEILKESDAARRAEIQGLREDLKRKDEALRKVKEVVVGWKAPR
jgi:hypothetical protein